MLLGNHFLHLDQAFSKTSVVFFKKRFPLRSHHSTFFQSCPLYFLLWAKVSRGVRGSARHLFLTLEKAMFKCPSQPKSRDAKRSTLSSCTPFFLDLLLVTVSGFIELFWPSCYFNLSSLQISRSTRVYPCQFPRYKVLKVSWNEQIVSAKQQKSRETG